MPTEPSTAVVARALLLILVALVSPPEATFSVSGLGSGSTVAVSYATATVCGIVAGERTQRIQCYRDGQSVYVQHEVSYEAIAGGESFFCGLRSGGLTLLCWDTGFSNQTSFHPKRIYHSQTDRLEELTVGDTQVCASKNNTGVVTCWRGGHIQGDGGEQSFPSPSEESKFSVITSGRGFSCGILKENRRVACWGNRGIGTQIQREFSDFLMSSLMAGENHACGLNTSGVLICRGNNDAGQLDVPSNSPPFVYSGLALGAYHTCAIRTRNGLLVCWGWGGGEGSGSGNLTNFTAPAATNVSFESIVAGLNFTCGLKTRSLTLFCWGPGWAKGAGDLPLPAVIPGPCVEAACTNCDCGVYPNSATLCYGWGLICKSCDTQLPFLLPLPTNPPRLPALPPTSDHVPTSSSAGDGGNNSLVVKAFAAVGALGAFSGVCLVVYVLWTKLGGALRLHTQQLLYGSAESNCRGIASGDRYGDGDLDLAALGSAAAAIKRQRSGPSSKHTAAAERAQEFGLEELAAATDNFSPQHKVGSGSFGSVYRGTLADGQEVAIKRRETCARRKREFQDKEAAFDAEVALLSRLHHKHLVGLVGFCNEEEERLLVYEYMSNGSLHSHLHAKWNCHKTSSVLNSWNMRIKIALDAARGIEYLHTYAVPPIIHRDIKSSNILLDANWTGKVSDFGLSLMRPECGDALALAPTRAVGTVGYIDPECYVLNVLTTKSDVYGLGVVLLELLTGKRAVFKNEDDGGAVPMGVVEYAVPRIAAEEVEGVLDPRIGPPTAREAEAVELVAHTAMHCVNLEVRERPTMTHIVAILERALASWEDSHGYTSTMSTASFYER